MTDCVRYLSLFILLFTSCRGDISERPNEEAGNTSNDINNDIDELEWADRDLAEVCNDCTRIELVVTGDYQGLHRRIGPIVIADPEAVLSMAAIIRDRENSRVPHSRGLLTSNQQWITLVSANGQQNTVHLYAFTYGFYPARETAQADFSTYDLGTLVIQHVLQCIRDRPDLIIEISDEQGVGPYLQGDEPYFPF